jgi:DNA-binding NtrC family response regulator
MEQPNKNRRVVLLSSDARERSVLADLLRPFIDINHVSSVAGMMALLTDDVYDALLCDWCFDNGTWRDAINLIKEHDLALPVVVLSAVGEEYEWLEALDDGAFDLLAAPWRKQPVIWALEHAFASRDARILRDNDRRLEEDERSVVPLL